MPVAAFSTAGFSQYISASSNVSASQQAWQTLGQSLASGNLSAAKSAFAAYSKLNPAQTATSSSSSGASQLSTDMAALGSALSSGKLSTAQSAFAAAQNDLKSTPSQAITNAETAVAQTVQWVDDLLSLSSTSSAPKTSVDPTTAMLDAAWGVNSNSSTTDPETALLESKYGDGTGSASSSGGTASTSGTSASTPSVRAVATSGNSGSAASVNAWA
jgi:hypothetical protein